MTFTLDTDHLVDVMEHRSWGRGCGKTIAHAQTVLQIIDSEPDIKHLMIVGPNERFLDFFQLALRKVCDAMEFSVEYVRPGYWMVEGRCALSFVPYRPAAERIRGANCLMYDANDMNDDTFTGTLFEQIPAMEYLEEIRHRPC